MPISLRQKTRKAVISDSIWVHAQDSKLQKESLKSVINSIGQASPEAKDITFTEEVVLNETMIY